MIIADTGFFLALLNADDTWHRRALQCLESLAEPLITTWPVLTETCHIILRRGGVFPMTQFMSNTMSGGVMIYSVPKDSHSRIPKLMLKYRELPMDLADASLVVLAEHLGHGRILSTDERDFKTYRWKDRKPFENLLAV